MTRTARRIAVIAVWLGIALVASLGAQGNQPGTGPDPAEDDYFFARGLDAKGHADLAITEYRKFLKRHGSHRRAAEVHYLLGLACHTSRDYEGGVNALTGLRTRFPNYEMFAEAMFRLGGCHLELGQFKRAANAYAAAAQRGGKDGYFADEAHYWQGESLFRAKDYARTAKVLTRFRQLHPKSDKLPDVLLLLGYARFRSGDSAGTVEALDDLLRRKVDEKIAVDGLYLKGEALLKLSRSGDAAEALETVLRRDPKGRHTANALEALGWARYQSGDYAKAVAAYDRRAGNRETEAAQRASLMAANAAYRGDDLDGARRRAKQLIPLGGAIGAEAAYLDGLAAGKLGDDAGAVESLQAGLVHQPSPALRGKILVQAGAALHNLGRREQSAAAYDQALQTGALGDLEDDALYGAGLAYHVQGRLDLAEKRLGALLANHPQSDLADEARFALAENAYKADDFGKAKARFVAYLKRADAKRVRAADAYYKLGYACYEAKDLPGAIDAFERQLRSAGEKNPFADEVRFFLGTAYRESGNSAKAKAAFEACVNANPKSDYAAKSLLELGNQAAAGGQRDAALAYFGRLDRAHGASTSWASGHYGAARVLMDAGKYAPAEKKLRTALARAKRPELKARIRFSLAQALVSLGRYDDAIAEGEAVLGMEGGTLHPDAQEIVGYASLKKGDPQAALSAFDRFLARYRKHELAPFVSLSRGLALDRLDRHTDAVGVFDDLLRRYPRFEKRDFALYHRALARESLGKLEPMERDLRTLVQACPRSVLIPEVLFRLGERCYATKRYDEATTAYAAVIADERSDPALHANALYKGGWAHFQAGRRAKAAKLFDTLAEKHDKSTLRGEAWYQGGLALQEASKPDAALVRFARLVKEVPKHKLGPLAKVRAGECCIALERWAQALKWFSDARRSELDAREKPMVLHGIGVANQGLERYDAAVQSLIRVANSLDGPLAAESQFRIGRCRVAQGRVDDAIGEFLKVSIVHSDSTEWAPRAMLEAAKLCHAAGRTQPARKVCADIVKDYPDSKYAKEARSMLARLESPDRASRAQR